MKTRQLITILILLAGFTLLREVEKKVRDHSEVLLNEVSAVIEKDTTRANTFRVIAQHTTYQK